MKHPRDHLVFGLLLVLVLWLTGEAAHAASAHVATSRNDITANEGAATTVVSPSFAVTSGHAIVAQVRWEGGGSADTATVACADTAGNTYTVGPRQNQTGADVVIATAYVLSSAAHGSNVVTCTISASRSYREIAVSRFSYAGTLSYIGSAGGFSNDTTTSWTTSSLTVLAGDLLVGGIGLYGYAQDAGLTVAAGWTKSLSTTSDSLLFPAYRVADSGASLAFSGTMSDNIYAAIELQFRESGASPPTLSSATPSGTLGTSTTATVGATTDVEEGTLYVVLSEADDVEEADPEEIEAGENENGDPADFADDAEVTDSSPSVTFTGVLTPETTYYYAMVQVTDAGYSNVLSGSFTTAAADIVATKLIFGSQPGNVIVGQTFGAFTVRAVNDSDALDEDFEDDVTVALQTGNGALAGTLTETAVAGIATFDDVHIDTLNTDAVIRATADGLTAADSDEFDVTAGEGGGTSGFPSSSRLGGVLQ